MGYICSQSGCTRMPRFNCISEHINPVQLPLFRGRDAPLYLQRIIQQCRSFQPKDRPTAHNLIASLIEHTGDDGSAPREADDSWKSFLRPEDYLKVSHIYCDNCGALAPSEHYHCSMCDGGDFDICPACVSKGIHCRDSRHKLRKRSREKGELVEMDD